MVNEDYVENFYQGIYLTETILGNPNGDFLDNSPRNFEGHVFTTDKCIKYNIRKYICENKENLENKENIIFFFPRLVDDNEKGDIGFKTRDEVFDYLLNGGSADYEENEFKEKFNLLKEASPDVRMFGGTFTFDSDKKEPKQIYGPIQLSYGIDINNADIIPLQIGAPFATTSGDQTTTGSEYVVDDAIISYDITINPNNHPNLLLKKDIQLFKESLWFGTNLRKSTSKKTDSKLLILVEFDNADGTVFNIGELKEIISIFNEDEHKSDNNEFIKIECKKLFSKLDKFQNYIKSIEFIYEQEDVQFLLKEKELSVKNDKFSFPNDEFKVLSDKITIKDPSKLLDTNNDD